MKKKYLYGHDSMNNAYVIENYPYGFLKTQMKVWVESLPKKGDRVWRQTLDPKKNRWNKPKASTFSPIMFLYIDEKDHVNSDGISQYSSPDEVKKFISDIGGENKLNKIQKVAFAEMSGKTLDAEDPTWTYKFDKTMKEKRVYALDIKFDVPSSLKLKHIIGAIDKIISNKKNAETFKQLMADDGTIRVLGRRGVMIAGPMKADSTYKQIKSHLKNKIKESVKESSYNDNSKRLGTPRGKAKWMKTDGVSDLPKSWEAKMKYWQEMIQKMTGYDVIE